MCIDKLDNIVNKYNNTYQSTIKMKPVNVKSNLYINLNEEDPKFEVVDYVRLSKYKIIFVKLV